MSASLAVFLPVGYFRPRTHPPVRGIPLDGPNFRREIIPISCAAWRPSTTTITTLMSKFNPIFGIQPERYGIKQQLSEVYILLASEAFSRFQIHTSVVRAM